jgi:hypothetical protein
VEIVATIKSYEIYHRCMTCFCGCETYEKDANGFKLGCIKCSHGPQNHDDEFRNISRKIS